MQDKEALISVLYLHCFMTLSSTVSISSLGIRLLSQSLLER